MWCLWQNTKDSRDLKLHTHGQHSRLSDNRLGNIQVSGPCGDKSDVSNMAETVPYNDTGPNHIVQS